MSLCCKEAQTNILLKPSINPAFTYYVSDTVPGTSNPHSNFKKSTFVLEMWELRHREAKTPQPQRVD